MNQEELVALDAQVRALFRATQLAEAEALLRPYLASGSGPLVLWRLLVEAIRPQGQIAETRVIQDMLVNTVPGDLVARFNLAETLLLLGEFDRGWREYQHRYGMPHTLAMGRRMQQPRWQGQPMPGKTLLIHDEQGYGDTFQFLRMLPWAQQRSGAQIVLEVNADTYPLAQRCLGFDHLRMHGQLPPAFDQHCELMSLPAAMGLSMADLPGPIPYMHADPQRVERWQARLAGLPRPLVALVWAGRPTHVNDANRSMALEQLAPLADCGAQFVAIQKGPAAAQALQLPAGMQVLSLSDEITGFEDTAAILSVVDLLISVDSSPVHLAGALGRPAWVMLPRTPDWRWLMDRSDTPWYPSLRLFRQQQMGQWSDVVTAMAHALRELAAPGR